MPNDHDALLATIVAWAQSDANVLALIVTGSRARLNATVDEFSDLDIEIIADDPAVLMRDDAWMQRFGRIWVCLPTVIKAPRYETRLVFYQGGMKADFSLCGAERVREMIDAHQLDGLYERGYRVLLDKSGLTAGLPAPSGAFPASKFPDQQEFTAVANEFWFEAAHIPRYLLRDDLWVVKFRDWTMKTLLLTMLEWHALARSAGPVDVWHIGVQMKQWVDERTWAELHDAFARFDTQASWHDLLATTQLFRRLAIETAALTGLTYPAETDTNITAYIATFEARISEP